MAADRDRKGKAMFFLSDMLNKKLNMPKPQEALPGRDKPLPTASKHFVSKRSLKGPYPEGLETAMFGLGCFWGAERLFWELPGVVVTAVAYQGGPTPKGLSPALMLDARREMPSPGSRRAPLRRGYKRG